MDMPDRITKSNSAKAQFRQELEDRTTRLAVGTFKLLDGLPKKNSTRVIAFQLGKSASSIGANYQEATRAESREDFGHKIQLALKEAAESCYWFGILTQLYPMHETIGSLRDECILLRNLLQSIGRSVRANDTQTSKHPKHPNSSSL